MSAVMDTPTKDEIEKFHQEAVTIITPSIPERADLLVECTQSILVQTIQVQQMVGMDTPARRLGPAHIRNTLLAHVQTEYVAFVDDDDLIDPDHVETLLTKLYTDSTDLAFSWYRKVGDAPDTPRFDEWNDDCDGLMHGGRNIIPVTVVARTEAIRAAGCFNPHDRYEDYGLWLRMLDNGCSFSIVPRETWTYRCMGDNRTWLSS